MIYASKILVLVRKGRSFYATLDEEGFLGNPGGGGSLRKKIVYTGQFFVFVDNWALPGDSWFLILLNYWNSPYRIVLYDIHTSFSKST